MINYEKDDFDANLDDIMESINSILNGTGDGYETTEEESDFKVKAKREDEYLWEEKKTKKK